MDLCRRYYYPTTTQHDGYFPYAVKKKYDGGGDVSPQSPVWYGIGMCKEEEEGIDGTTSRLGGGAGGGEGTEPFLPLPYLVWFPGFSEEEKATAAFRKKGGLGGRWCFVQCARHGVTGPSIPSGGGRRGGGRRGAEVKL